LSLKKDESPAPRVLPVLRRWWRLERELERERERERERFFLEARERERARLEGREMPPGPMVRPSPTLRNPAIAVVEEELVW